MAVGTSPFGGINFIHIVIVCQEVTKKRISYTWTFKFSGKYLFNAFCILSSLRNDFFPEIDTVSVALFGTQRAQFELFVISII